MKHCHVIIFLHLTHETLILIFTCPSITMGAAILAESCRKLSDHRTCCSNNANNHRLRDHCFALAVSAIHPFTQWTSGTITVHNCSASITATTMASFTTAILQQRASAQPHRGRRTEKHLVPSPSWTKHLFEPPLQWCIYSPPRICNAFFSYHDSNLKREPLLHTVAVKRPNAQPHSFLHGRNPNLERESALCHVSICYCIVK